MSSHHARIIDLLTRLVKDSSKDRVAKSEKKNGTDFLAARYSAALGVGVAKRSRYDPGRSMQTLVERHNYAIARIPGPKPFG